MTLSDEAKLSLVCNYDLMDVAGKDYACSLVAQERGMRVREVTDEDVLQYHKDLLKGIFNNNCDNEIEIGFRSHVNNHHYRTNRDDQINFIGQYLLLKDVSQIQQIFWKTEDAEQVPITRDEFFSIYREALMHKNNIIQKYWYKKIEVDACVTHEQVRNVTWFSPIIVPSNPAANNPAPVEQPAPVTETPVEEVPVETQPVTEEPVADTQPLPEIENLIETHTDTTVLLTWQNPQDTNFSSVNVYRDLELIVNTTGESFAEDQLTPSTVYAYDLKTLDLESVESVGVAISVTTDDAPIVEEPSTDTTTEAPVEETPTDNTTDSIIDQPVVQASILSAPEEKPEKKKGFFRRRRR